MKKTISILLIVLLVPLNAVGGSFSDKYVGTWIHYQPTGMTARQYIIYELDNTGKAYYSKETFYTDGTPSVLETSICTWEDTGTNIVIMNDSGFLKELYYIDPSKLSSDKQGAFGIYNRVLLTEEAYDVASASQSTATPTTEQTPILLEIPVISDLNYDELVNLKDQINMAMWNSQEWQEVTVPAGTWEIGTDIPAGHWSISVSGHGYVSVWYCEKVDKFGDPVCFGAQYKHKEVASEDFHAFDQTYNHVIDFDVEDGWFLCFDADVIFTPYTGKPNLGFK